MKHIRHCLTALFAITISLMVWADSGELFTSGKLSSSLINCIVGLSHLDADFIT